MKRLLTLSFATVLILLSATPLLYAQNSSATQKNARYQKDCDAGDPKSCGRLAIAYSSAWV